MPVSETVQMAMARAGLNAKLAVILAATDFVSISANKALEACEAECNEKTQEPRKQISAAMKSDQLPAVV